MLQNKNIYQSSLSNFYTATNTKRICSDKKYINYDIKELVLSVRSSLCKDKMYSNKINLTSRSVESEKTTLCEYSTTGFTHENLSFTVNY